MRLRKAVYALSLNVSRLSIGATTRRASLMDYPLAAAGPHRLDILLIMPRRTTVHWSAATYYCVDPGVLGLRRKIVAQALGLAFDQATIDAAREAQQVGMVAVLDDASVVEDQNAVELAHRRQTVGDDERRAAPHQRFHGVLDQGLRLAVETRGGFIQDQDRRIGQEGARNRDPLALAAGELDAALADQRGIALWQPLDEGVGMGQPRRRFDLHRRGVGPPISDVLGQRAVEEQRFLLHDRHLPAQALLRDVGDILPVDRDAAAIEVVQPLHELDEGRLARARPSDKADALARRDADRQGVVDLPVERRIAKAHLVELDVAARDRHLRGTGPVLDAERLLVES